MRYVLLFLVLFSFDGNAQSLKGAWENKENDKISLILATDNYLTVSTYESNKFVETWGGKYENGVTNEVFVEVEFHSNNPAIVNSSQSFNFSLKKKHLEFNDKKFTKIDQKDNALTGLWRITSRANVEGVLEEMKMGPRKTLKIMSGGYFQWFAINTQTREFFGTGGGKYGLIDGLYSEKIEFFSRDNSRVGAELKFNAEVTEKQWIHSGKSSKGDPIKEIWTKQ